MRMVYFGNISYCAKVVRGTLSIHYFLLVWLAYTYVASERLKTPQISQNESVYPVALTRYICGKVTLRHLANSNE